MIKRVYHKLKRIIENRGVFLHEQNRDITDHAREVARSIRGDRLPSVILHGVTQRSGSTYLGELLKLHPDVSDYPNGIKEVPFLESLPHLVNLNVDFLNKYEHNIGIVGGNDFLPLFGSALIRYLSDYLPGDRRMLIKVPGAGNLDRFFNVFPGETPVLLMRDGRDVVTSAVKTWPERSFDSMCRYWKENAQSMLQFHEHHRDASYYVKYEDILENPDSIMGELCEFLGLEKSTYPFDSIAGLPVHGSSSIKVGGKVTWEPQKKPENFKPVARWKEWSDKQKEIFKKIAGETLIQAGYVKSNDW